MKIYTNEDIKQKKAKKQKIIKILRYIFMPIVVLIIIAFGYIGYQKIVQKKNNIELLGYQMYVVLTGSMKPEIEPNDIVVIKKVENPDELKEGDIITFSVGNSATVTHRIVEVINNNNQISYKTKGDNNNTEDLDLVKFQNVQGKFKLKISSIGAVLTGGITGTGAIVILLLIVLSYHHSSKMEDRALTREDARKRYNVYKYKDKEDTNE